MTVSVGFYHLNGTLVAAEEARLHVSDLGLLRAYAVFDFFRVVDGVPLFLNDYLARFERSVRLLELELPCSLAALEAGVHALIDANGVADAGVQLLLTGGYTPDGFSPGEPNLLMLERPLTLPDPALYETGAKLILHEYRRDIPEAKTTNYTVAIKLLGRQRAQGALDVLYHQGSRVSETARSNLFTVKNGVLKTPGQDVLKGVTRKQLLNLARGHYQVLETELRLEDVYGADEVFISSTLKGVMPVVALDGQSLGGGRPGPVSKHLAELFAGHVQDYVAARKT